MAWYFRVPDIWHEVPENERDRRVQITPDQCVIDDEHFFLRGVIEIPVIDSPEVFIWGVWTSLSRENFDRSARLWESPDRINEPPYFGWLCNEIPGYESTLHFKTHVHSREVGLRPLVELEHTDHPLAVEQREGITMERVRKIAEHWHHLKP